MDLTYKLTQSESQVLRSDGYLIQEGNNSDWKLYQDWLAADNTPDPADLMPIVRSIDARRLRLALLQLDLLDIVEAAIATLGKAAQIEWEFAIDIKENYSLVEALSTNLNLDTDAIFTLASSLE
ncbi:hypothetical protein [Phormidium tenue]|uniref:Uncharacterized protein n=1 Tax=Phormidium tenue FACHB-1050 TaxID=2692857 RepID=A0ABR8C7E2_9CYAN|nr:hypothetical protein [Phormidium tenue]MBD2316643.1 hypothetical protein [Phormidium tenue FACHB-1050]